MRTPVALVLLLLAGCGPDRVEPPPPRAAGEWTDTAPPLPPSYVAGPVRYHLGPALAWLDSTIPPRLGSLEQKRKSPDDERLSYAFELQRDQFALSVRRRSATLQTDVAYRARAWYNPPVLPELGASCGVEGPAPRARLAVTMDVRLAPDWTLHPQAKTLVDPLSGTDHDKCTITTLDIDVTGAVMSAAREALQEKAEDAAARLAAMDLPREAKRIWGILHQPLRITDSLWLNMNPEAVRIGALTLRGDTLVTTVGLTGRPRVVGGARPKPRVGALPAPGNGATGASTVRGASSFQVMSEGRLSYDVASTILTRELRGEVELAAKTVTLDSVHLSPVGDGRVAAGLSVKGPVTGLLYAVGTPMYDSATSELFIPDLKWDAATHSMLTGSLAWLAGETVERFLRSKVRVDLGPTLEDGRRLLEESLNQEIGDGVQLRAKIRSGQVHDIRAAPEALLVRAVVWGSPEILLTPTLDQIRGKRKVAARDR